MTEKRFTYLNTSGWNKDGFLNVMNGLNEKNKKLEKENEELKKAEILANYRGEMISFATALIDDLGSQTMKEMWDKFKNEKYEKWCELE